MLKMTDIKLEKISDIDKYLFIEKGLRGGISYIAKICTKANNKYMNDYDPKKQSSFISYLDMNNLYGWAMSECLPYERFKWLENVDRFYEIKVGDVKKLIPNLGNKTNYVVHYRNLQLYLSLGMKLTKIHRVKI